MSQAGSSSGCYSSLAELCCLCRSESPDWWDRRQSVELGALRDLIWCWQRSWSTHRQNFSLAACPNQADNQPRRLPNRESCTSPAAFTALCWMVRSLHLAQRIVGSGSSDLCQMRLAIARSTGLLSCLECSSHAIRQLLHIFVWEISFKGCHTSLG